MKTYKRMVEFPRLVITCDDNSINPREYHTNLGYLITVSNRYRSPDNIPELKDIIIDTANRASSVESHIRLICKEMKEKLSEEVIAIFPICIYEHGSILYTFGPNYDFDCSNNSFYIITDKTLKEYASRVDENEFENIVRQELDIYNRWINGEIYMYTLYDNKGKIIDSCGDFYSLDDIKSDLPEEWKDEDLNEYVRL